MKITESPLLVFDVETTGLSLTEDRVVEFGVALFTPGSPPVRRRALVNPGRSIDPGAAKVHGITDAKVAECEPFGVHLDRIAPHFEGRVLVGYNALFFDTPLINNHAAACGHAFRIGTERLLDVMVFVNWHHRGDRSRKLVDVAAKYGVKPKKGAAHSAAVDCEMTGELLLAMVAKGVIEDDVEAALAAQAKYRVTIDEEYSTWDYWIFRDRVTGRLRIGAGKHAGMLLAEVDKSYLSFMIGKAEDMKPAAKEAFGNATRGKLSEEVQTSVVDVPRGEKKDDDWGVTR